MKKVILIVLILSEFTIRAQFVDFTDNTSNNRFLGLDLSMCSTQTNNSKNNYQKSYDCGNGTISDLLNVNILSPGLLGQQFYLFNNFMYWMAKNIAGSQNNIAKSQQPDAYFSGSGVFQVILGTTPYLQQIVTPQKTCPTGQTLVVAQLKYNDGNTVSCWSQDSVCMAPTDSFSIAITKDQDDTVLSKPAVASTSPDAQSINWMQDAGPSANYLQAGDSPRKIRLVKQAGAAPIIPPSTVPAVK